MERLFLALAILDPKGFLRTVAGIIGVLVILIGGIVLWPEGIVLWLCLAVALSIFVSSYRL